MSEIERGIIYGALGFAGAIIMFPIMGLLIGLTLEFAEFLFKKITGKSLNLLGHQTDE